ncbi:MAG: type IV pilus modification PilV family protein [Candidatus Dormibacteraceae bacterium]
MDIRFAKADSRPLDLDREGMTLVEVVVALAISGLAVAAIVGGYMFSSSSAEQSALSVAATAKAIERIEQTRSATWDTISWPPVDQLVVSNFPAQVVTLDLSGSGPGATYATNFTQISDISSNPPVRRIRVDCVWLFAKRARLLTNTIETCRGPDE